MKNASRIGGALGVVLALSGCRETTPSDYVRTDRIAALVDITAESAESVTVRVELHAGGADSPTYVVLHTGDELRATAGGETRDLQSAGEGVYEGTFGTGAETEVTVNFDRAEHEDAPASKGTLPPPFTLQSPASGDVLSRTQDELVITWTPVAEAAGRIDLGGSCIAPASYDVAGDAGELAIGKGELETSRGDADDTCDVEIVVTFTRRGVADPALDEDSYVLAHQVRSVSFFSNP